METLITAFRLVLYILGSISLVTLIILMIKLTYTVDKANEILDDVDSKVKTLDGLFNAISTTSSAISSIGDKIFDKVLGLIGKISKKNKNKKEEEFYE